MNIEELIHDLRARINPQYYDQVGTESYERHQCVMALEYLATENERLKELMAKRAREHQQDDATFAALRDEVNGLTGSLDRAESVLQNLMSYLSVNGCRTEIDPENAELRILDGINMLVRPAAERAERAEAALKEARDVITELADDLSIELDMRYQSRSHYPSELRKYENEMQPVYRARALLQSTGDKK